MGCDDFGCNVGRNWNQNSTRTQPIPESTSIRLTIPLVPPSVNHYVKHTHSGRHYVTSEAKAFKDAVGIIASGRSLAAKQYEVGIDIHLGRGDRGDIDNFPKCCLDALVDCGLIGSDAAIKRLIVEKFRDRENPRTEITIRSLAEVRL